ncbi:hypothetical protein KY345_04780 [Candidatus Woesearchaeota archaeon]|nr:hypothetical protein [Candidatus Woesearchaeota archaeon]
MGHIIGSTYFAPEWFFGYDIVLELIFVAIILAVSYYALKVYKLSGLRQSKHFSLAFMFIAASYFVQSVYNFWIISLINKGVTTVLGVIGLNAFNITGYFFQIFFFLLGLITLLYMTLKIKSRKTYFLIVILTAVALLLTPNRIYAFYLLSSIFLIYLVIHFFNYYMKKKQAKTLLVLSAFAFLLFGSIQYILSLNNGLFYVLGHFSELIAYSLILINLILVVKK